jgi:HPt (histidine-containing phosphotransfer) domain-containing protein
MNKTDEAIALLMQELDAETVGDLIEQFLADTPAQIVTMRQAFESQDMSTLGRAAHSVAGSSSTFGLEDLRAAVLALEDAAEAGESEKIPASLEAVGATYEAASARLRLFKTE